MQSLTVIAVAYWEDKKYLCAQHKEKVKFVLHLQSTESVNGKYLKKDKVTLVVTSYDVL